MHRDIVTGKALPENFFKADKIGDEMYLSFLNDCLIKGKASLYYS